MSVFYSQLKSLDVVGKNDHIGKVTDLMFDDRNWLIRYIVVQTGSWFVDRKIVLGPGSFAAGALNFKADLRADLTREQVENSPLYEDHLPVSRQYEDAIHQHYGWLPYWNSAQPTLFHDPELSVAGAGAPEMQKLQWSELAAEEQANYDPHLRSFSELSSYQVASSDEETFGDISDLAIAANAWQVVDLVINSRRWLPGGKDVVVSPKFVRSIDEDRKLVHVNRPKDIILSGPEFEQERYDSEYRGRLIAHYNQSK